MASRMGVAPWIMVVFMVVGVCWRPAWSADVEGSSDHPLVSRYAGSEIIGYEFREHDRLELPLGAEIYDRDAGEKMYAESQILQGRRTRILYVAPAGRSSLEVISNYRSSLLDNGFEELFTCHGRECGRSFASLFYPRTRRLDNSGQRSELALGSPQDQRFAAMKMASPEGEVVVAVYAAVNSFDGFKDTAGRVMTLLEIVEPTPMDTGMVVVDADALAASLENTGHAAVYGIYFATDSADLEPESAAALKEMCRLFKAQPELSAFVVGHTDIVGDLVHNMDLSKRRAQAVMTSLIEECGIAQDRLEAHGVGPLAAVATNGTEAGRARNRRVELVAR